MGGIISHTTLDEQQNIRYRVHIGSAIQLTF